VTFDDPILKKELEDKWQHLQSCPEFAGKLAGPFFGHAPKTFAKSNTKILYIGKATAGTFDEPDASRCHFGANEKMFWSFARRLGSKTGDPTDPLANIAWSNLCKIGTRIKNPGAALAIEQQELAVKILSAEIQFLQPSLIVCVAGYTIYDDFFYKSLNTTRGQDGFLGKPQDNPTLYVRSSLPPYPPILWMRHPQFRPASYLDFAEAEALQLLKSKTSN
jgi:hypothetical protein